jgi:hypothetical protein
MSRVSEGSEFMHQSQTIPSKPPRKPLPLAHKASYAIIGRLNEEPDSHTISSPLRSNEMHRVWLLLVEAERNFFDRMGRLRKMFYDNIIRQWPALEPHLGIVLICEQLAAINKKLLWLPMEQQLLDSDQSTGNAAIFNTWTTNVQRLFREYCQALPHAIGAVRATQNSDGKFAPFVNTLGLSIAYFGKDWEDYMRLPLAELDFCIESIRNLLRIAASLKTPDADKETQRLARALDALAWLQTTSAALLDEAQSREDTQDLERRISTLDTDILSQLNLLAPTRRVTFKGAMTMKLKSKGPWHPVHVVLLDNYLFWGKLRSQKKSSGVDKILVLEEVSLPPNLSCMHMYVLTNTQPIPVDELEASLPPGQQQFQKATLFDEVPRNSVQYMISIKRRSGGDGKAHLLGCPSYQERKAWMDCFEAVDGEGT